MKGISRKDQDVAGGVAIEGSNNVFINNYAVVRNGDRVNSHGLPPHSPPPAMIAECKNFYVNSILVVREDNLATCGHSITGSTNTFVGE